MIEKIKLLNPYADKRDSYRYMRMMINFFCSQSASWYFPENLYFEATGKILYL